MNSANKYRYTLILLLLILVSCGGGFKNYPSTPIDEVDFLSHTKTKTENGITVTTSVLTQEETDKIFGVNLFSKGIQPVWLDITNNTESTSHWWASACADCATPTARAHSPPTWATPTSTTSGQ